MNYHRWRAYTVSLFNLCLAESTLLNIIDAFIITLLGYAFIYVVIAISTIGANRCMVHAELSLHLEYFDV